jgi:hypothetical protein
MRSIQQFLILIFFAFCVCFTAGIVLALTPEQVISLKKAGVSDETIQLMIRQEQEAAAGTADASAGRKEIKDRDGKTVIIYSTGRHAGNNRSKEEKQTEKAWKMLNNLIIDTGKFK